MRPVALRRISAVLLALGLIGLLGVSQVLAAGITVNSLTDTAADDGVCTLHEAIIAANTDTASGATLGECAAGSSSDVITFSVAGTITLASGLPAITSDVTIDGAAAITVNGATSFRPFTITGGTVGLSGLAIVNGRSTADDGGGIKVNAATLTVSNSTISGNAAAAGFRGGGIWQFGGTLLVTGSTISGNAAPGGAGITSIDVDLTVENSTISGNTATLFGGGLYHNGGSATVTNSTISGNAGGTIGGGGIYNQGDITLTNSTISGNSASSGGGVFNAFGTVTVTNSTISSNSAAGVGGGIQNPAGTTLTVASSTVSGNSAGAGGGINSEGTATVSNATISDNTASVVAGGVRNVGTMTFTNTTISGNTSTIAGGIYNNGGTMTFTNTTISGNAAIGSAGGVRAQGTETVVNTIVAGNTAPLGPDVDFVFETVTTSILGVPGGKTLADILVPAGLANNGGPTQTIALALVAGNPAIDTATGAVCAAAPVNAVDQRGSPRPAACDIGAYEAQPPTVAAQPNASVAATSASGAVVTYSTPAGTDEQGGVAPVACLPASGSTFPVGSTTVTCTATDAVGHTGTGTFLVNVGDFAASPGETTPDAAAPSGTGRTGSLLAVVYTLTVLTLLSGLAWRWTVGARRRTAS